MKCLILAGGFGTRLYPHTIKRTKGLLEYRGKPLLTRIIDNISQDISILVTTNRRFESDFNHWVKTINRPIEICIEEAQSEQQKLGTVPSTDYWIKNKNITEDLLVIAADSVR
ncbi:sugar phosphate nucleotidyltransferase [Chloroflexota bacterium]